MATWRRKALERFPDLRLELKKPNFSVYLLFFELLPRLRIAFEEHDENELKGIFSFADWCLEQGSDLRNAAGVSLYEHLFDGSLDPEIVVPWLSPLAIAECRPLWEWTVPDKIGHIDKLIASRKSFKYRELYR